MNILKSGEFFGSHNDTFYFNDVTITDTEYTLNKVDWHYHENAYFTYILKGKLFEANKKNTYYLEQGSLLFHNWQDAHYNIKPPIPTHGFHIEIKASWLKKYGLVSDNLEGSIHLKNPIIKSLINKIFWESKLKDKHSQLSIEMLLLEIFCNIEKEVVLKYENQPLWVSTLKTILFEEPQICYSLTKLAEYLDIHPVHLSRGFSKYFHTTLGQYLRLQKLNKAVLLINDNKSSLTDIAHEVGFYDQSHFISNFKKIYSLSPLKFKKQLTAC